MKIEKKINSTKGQVFVIDSNQFEVDRQLFKSKKEFQSQVIQLILSKLIGVHTLSHLENGAPYLKDSPYNISISHCDNLFAIYISKVKVGIDIETIKKDITKAKPFFINSLEQSTKWSFEELYLIWCAKEAIYKSLDGTIKDLAKEVTINQINEGRVYYKFDSKEDQLFYLKIDNWILAYT